MNGLGEGCASHFTNHRFWPLHCPSSSFPHISLLPQELTKFYLFIKPETCFRDLNKWLFKLALKKKFNTFFRDKCWSVKKFQLITLGQSSITRNFQLWWGFIEMKGHTLWTVRYLKTAVPMLNVSSAVHLHGPVFL